MHEAEKGITYIVHASRKNLFPLFYPLAITPLRLAQAIPPGQYVVIRIADNLGQ